MYPFIDFTGGTVYHDTGNLNCSFFSSRARYNRRSNLEYICRSLKSNWNLDLTISQREDIVLNNFKVSGTAYKLGHKNAYHHWCEIYLIYYINTLKFEDEYSLLLQYSACWCWLIKASENVACFSGNQLENVFNNYESLLFYLILFYIILF